MNQYIKYMNFAFCIVMVLGLCACNDDEFEYYGESDYLQFSISATPQYLDDESRAVFDEANKSITNYCLLVFSKKASNGVLLHANDLGNDLSSTFELIPTNADFWNGSSLYAILLGNVTKEQLGLTIKESTVSDLYNKAASINSTYNNPTDIKQFTWSGYRELTKDKLRHSFVRDTLNFTINPNVAKVKLIVNNTSSNTNSGNESTQVVSAQVCNVKDKVRYAQNALSKAGLFTKDNNSTGNASLINYNKEEISVVPNGGTRTLYWYVPCNMLASGVRNSNIPEGATYLELASVRGTDHMSVNYKIYLGVNSNNVAYKDLTNFDVRPDHVYNVTVNITNDGLTFNTTTSTNTLDKTSGTSIGAVKLPPYNNCYMIHPKYSDSVNPNVPSPMIHNTTVYELPIYERINEYWGNSWNITGIGNSANVIGDQTEWKMEVIWQEMNARVLYFCDANGVNEYDTYVGKGKTPVYFKLDRNALTNAKNRDVSTNVNTDIYGNILVGVKKKKSDGTYEDGYLWSWHLWVTDYVPNETSKFSTGSTLLYELTKELQATPSYDTSAQDKMADDGNVQHFYDNAASGTNNATYWTKSKAIWTTGIYKNKWIMDRNLGAQIASNMRVKDPVEAFGLYYQYGRKDPFPFRGAIYQHSSSTYSDKYKLYEIDGQTTVSWSPSIKNVTHNEATNNPTTTYVTNSYWTTKTTTYTWNNPVALSTNQKSIFDPCPPGWTIPYKEAFEFVNRINWAEKTDVRGYAYVYLSDTKKAAHGTLRTCTMITLPKTDLSSFGLSACFPAQGFVSPVDGKLVPPESSNPPDVVDHRMYMWFADGYVDANHRTGFGFGYENNQGQTKIDDIGASSVFQFRKWYRAIYSATFSVARGHNIRCIQLPD